MSLEKHLFSICETLGSILSIMRACTHTPTHTPLAEHLSNDKRIHYLIDALSQRLFLLVLLRIEHRDSCMYAKQTFNHGTMPQTFLHLFFYFCGLKLLILLP